MLNARKTNCFLKSSTTSWISILISHTILQSPFWKENIYRYDSVLSCRLKNRIKGRMSWDFRIFLTFNLWDTDSTYLKPMSIVIRSCSVTRHMMVPHKSFASLLQVSMRNIWNSLYKYKKWLLVYDVRFGYMSCICHYTQDCLLHSIISNISNKMEVCWRTQMKIFEKQIY